MYEASSPACKKIDRYITVQHVFHYFSHVRVELVKWFGRVLALQVVSFSDTFPTRNHKVYPVLDIVSTSSQDSSSPVCTFSATVGKSSVAYFPKC